MKNVSIGILLFLSFLISPLHAFETRYHPQHLFIKMKPGKGLITSDLIKSSKKLFGDLYLVKTSSALDLENELKKPQFAKFIDYSEKDYYSQKTSRAKHEVLEKEEIFLKSLQDFDLRSFFNDPYASRLWAFNSTTGLDVLGAYEDLPNYTPRELVVAVVDTGVDHNHEDLQEVMWINKGEIPNNGVDDDGNGYIDDIHGINTLIRDAQGRATMNTMASHWHGTHVAGTIAATQNNGIGIAGVANNVKIMAIRTVPDASDVLDSDIVEAFLYAAKMGAKIINCSFGKKHNEGGMVVRDTMNKIAQQGVLVVVSAGNDSFGPFRWHNNDRMAKYPASFDSKNMLVVASTASSGNLSEFSNIGPVTVDVASPGSSIYSTINGNRYSAASGTFTAAPNASGVAAMIMGYYPQLSVSQVKDILMSTTTKSRAFEGKIKSGGRLNLKAALLKAKSLSY